MKSSKIVGNHKPVLLDNCRSHRSAVNLRDTHDIQWYIQECVSCRRADPIYVAVQAFATFLVGWPVAGVVYRKWSSTPNDRTSIHAGRIDV